MWPPCYLQRILSAAVDMSAMCTKMSFAGNDVFCVCSGMHRQSNQMTYEKYITDASNLIGKAKFVVTVVGPVALLSTDAALESRLTSRQVQGTLT